MTKKQTHQWLKDVGLNSFYSGKTHTMYVDDVTQEMLDGYMVDTEGFELKACPADYFL